MPYSRPLNTFEEDKLGRETLSDYLTTFIETTIPAVNEYSFVLALNSPWGTGKTSFIQMWRNKLEKSGDRYNFITYNAWENDDSDSALIPLICSFSQLNGVLQDEEKISETVKNVLKIVLPRAGNFLSKLFLKTDLSDLTNAARELKNMSSPDVIYDNYKSTTEIKQTFRELIQACTKDSKKLIIFIDELDRCRPTFAIETLEAIKHFFDQEDVIFIISLDMNQLAESIKVVYGNINTGGYLQRFFDYQIALPNPSLREYLSERLKDGNFVLESEVDLLEKINSVHPLSLRDLNVICKAYLHFLNTKVGDKQTNEIRLKNVLGSVAKGIYLFFITLKYSDTELYLKIIKEGIKLDSIPGGEKVIRSVFATSLHISETRLYYSPEMVEKTLDQLQDSGDKVERNAYQVLLNYSGAGELGHKFYRTKLSEAVFNMVEYGKVAI